MLAADIVKLSPAIALSVVQKGPKYGPGTTCS